MWVRTTDFGDDKDRVIRRGNGVYTYFAADAAYYLDKGDRGFGHKIYLLGADHHGYVHRLKALAGAAGDDPEKDIEVLIGQLVSVNGAKLSKRAGNIIELDDLQAWLGTDALRYTLARYPADSPLTIDPEILQQAQQRQPRLLRAVRARAHLQRRAQRRGIRCRPLGVRARAARRTRRESALLGALQEFPRIVAQAAELREPHRVARYLEELAGLYHRWYDNCRVHAARRRADRRPAPHAALAERRHGPGHPQRARPARRLRTGAHVMRGPGEPDEPQSTDAATGASAEPRADDTGATAVIPVDEQATEVIAPAAPAAAAPARRGRRAAAPPPRRRGPAPPAAPTGAPAPRRRRAARIWITVVAIVVALVALVVVADIVVRNVAEARFAEEIEANLPDGVEGDVGVTIGGFSVIAQYLSGSMDHVELSAPELVVDGTPICGRRRRRGRSASTSRPVEHLTATLEADEAAVNQLDQRARASRATWPSATARSATRDPPGSSASGSSYSVTAEPTAAGDTVLLQPVGVEVGAGGGSLDVSGIVERLLGDDPVARVRRRSPPRGRRGAADHRRAVGRDRRARGRRHPPRRGEPRDDGLLSG